MLEERTDISQPYVHSKGLLLHLWFKKKHEQREHWALFWFLIITPAFPMERKGQILALSKFASENFQRSSLAGRTVPWLAWWHTKGSCRVQCIIPDFQNHPADHKQDKAPNSIGLEVSKFSKILPRTQKGTQSSNPNCSLARLTWYLTPPECSEEQHYPDRILLEKKCSFRKLSCKGSNFT